MTSFERMLAAANALPAEDVPLLLRTLLGRYPVEEWPALFTGRDLEEVRLLILWLVLDLEPAEPKPASTDTLTAPEPVRVSPAELQAAALTFARAFREHLADSLARRQLETLTSGARCLEHLVGLVGPAVAAKAFAHASQEPPTAG